jgi:hypothetical protein
LEEIKENTLRPRIEKTKPDILASFFSVRYIFFNVFTSWR